MVENLKNKELEEAVLGAIIANHETYTPIAEIFDLSLFTNSDHENVAKIILRLKNEGKQVDLLTVTDQMKKSDYFNPRFGIYELSKLSDRINSTQIIHIHEHALILQQYAIKRKIVAVSNKTIYAATAFNSDVFDVIDLAEQGISEITSKVVSSTIQTPEELHANAIIHNEKILSLKGGLSGITSGFRKIDDLTGGWQNGTLIIVAGATSMGKSAIALDFLLAASMSGNPTALFSLEVSSGKIYSRLQAKVSGIDLERITKIGLSASDMVAMNLSCQGLQRSKMYFDDVSNLTIFQLKNKARNLKRKFGIKLIIIDYLQLMAGVQKGNREQEIASISRGLKALSKELDIPVIVLSQLSREIEKRADKEPKLSDLRESGAIEQDADIVSFVYRPEYYGITQSDSGESLIGKAKWLCKKNREGALGEVKLDYIGRLTKFQSEGIDDPKPLEPNNTFLEPTEKF